MCEKQLSKKAEQLTSSDDNDAMEQVLFHVGGLGTYQRLLFLMMMPLGFIYMFVYAVQMFVTATPQQHWCKVPELMHLDIELRRNLSIPGAASRPGWERCAVFAANWTAVLASLEPPAPATPTVPCPHGWEFLYHDIPYPTVVSEREWVCDKASYAPTAQAFFFVGSLVGCGLFGWLGDKYGRVPSLIASNLIGCVGGIASVFTVGLWDFIFCRFLVGLANDCCFMMMYIIGCVAGIFLPALALWLADWRQLLIVTSLPMLLVLAAPWAVPESARWLASTGKINRAIKVLKKFERVNKTEIPEDVLHRFIVSSSKSVETDESMIALVRSAPVRNCMVLLILVTVACSLLLDAIIRLSETIGDSFFVTFALSSMVEIPSLALLAFILDRLGRRFLSFLTAGLSGILCLVCALVPQGTPQLVMALVVRFCSNMSYGLLLQLAAELLPTALRALGTSAVHMTVFVSTTLSPYIVYSGTVRQELPLLILAGLGVLGGGLALLLPETRDKPMPQTIADAERLVREGVLCGKPEIEDAEHQEVIFLENKNAIVLHTSRD